MKGKKLLRHTHAKKTFPHLKIARYHGDDNWLLTPAGLRPLSSSRGVMEAKEEELERRPLLRSAVEETSTGDDGVFKAYKRRWYVLLVFSLLSSHQSHVWLTFGVIPDETHAYYGVGQWQVDLLAGERDGERERCPGGCCGVPCTCLK